MNKKYQKKPLFYNEYSITAFDYIIYFLIFFFLCNIVFVTLFSRCDISGESMEKTLFDGDILLINNYKTTYNNGDIIIIQMDNEQKPLVKRIVATEGESFYFMSLGGNVFLFKKNSDGIFLSVDEPYINGYMNSWNFSTSVFSLYDPADPSTIYTVPKNSYLFLGDNRNHSIDSRVYSYAKYENIIGKMICKVEPKTLLYYFITFLFSKS